MSLTETAAATCEFCDRVPNATVCHAVDGGSIEYDIPVCDSHIRKYLDGFAD